MSKKKQKDFDYGFGITQADLERYQNRPQYLHNEMIRPEGQSFADFICEEPFLDDLTEEQKKEYIKIVKQAAGFEDDDE